MAEVEERNNELKSKLICRCCMNQDVSLTNIYSRENRLKSTVPLPLQIMACVSIEVFTNDGMPSTICDSCRMLMDHSYRFKQMCKKADTMLKQYPLTGSWPKALELPRIPMELIKKQQKQNTSEQSTPMLKRPASSPAVASPQMKRLREGTSPKILNKNSPKLLNKNVRASPAPVMSVPIIKTDDSGNVEIITELLENVESYEEPDPVKFAPPVETNVFPCPRCDRSFPLRQLLEIHMTNHSRERSFPCNICDKKFFSKYDLGKHSLIHSGEKPYQCVVCSKTFSRSTLLHRHEKVHTDQPRYLCVFCDRPFLSRTELDKHSETHKKNRPFSCTLCNKSFAFKQGLERHEVVHLKEQPYPCEYCDQSFPTPSKLARHLTAHAGERPYPCKLCPKSFLLSHHLTRHLRSHAAGAGSYKCSDCEIVFSSKDDLIYHSAVHATQNLTCPLCKEQFNDLDSVTEHIKSHSVGEQYACDYCDLIFSNAEKLDEHCSANHIEDGYVEDENQSHHVIIKKEMKDMDSDSEEDDDERRENDEEEQHMENNDEETDGEGEENNEQVDEYVVEEVEEEGTDGGEKKISLKTLQVMKSRPMNAAKQYGSKRSVSPPKAKSQQNDNSSKQSLITKYTKKVVSTPPSHNSSLEQGASSVESLKRPLRNNKIKDYAKLVKNDLKYQDENDDEDMEEEQEEEPTASDEDEDYVAEEEDDEETTKKSNSRVYKSRQPQRYSNEKVSQKEKTNSPVTRRSGNENRSSDQTKEKLSIQDKVSQFIKINDNNTNKVASATTKVVKKENTASVEKVLKNLPKGVTVSKKESPQVKTTPSSTENVSSPSNAVRKVASPVSNNDTKGSNQTQKIVKKESVSPSIQKKIPSTQPMIKKPNNAPLMNTKTYSMKKTVSKPDTPEVVKKSNSDEKTKSPSKSVTVTQKVILTKAEVEKMTKEGKITIQEDGTMILLTTHGKKSTTASGGDSSTKSSSGDKNKKEN